MTLNADTTNNINDMFKEIEQILNLIKDEDLENPDEDALKYVEWMKKKAELRYGKIKNEELVKTEYPKFPIFPTGIYWAYLGVNVGSEENKHRPVLVLRASRQQDQCTIIPLSTQRLKDDVEFHVDLTEFDNTVLVEQLRVISKKRLDKPLRHKGNIASVKNESDLEKIYGQLSKYFATRPPKRGPSK